MLSLSSSSDGSQRQSHSNIIDDRFGILVFMAAAMLILPRDRIQDTGYRTLYYLILEKFKWASRRRSAIKNRSDRRHIIREVGLRQVGEAILRTAFFCGTLFYKSARVLPTARFHQTQTALDTARSCDPLSQNGPKVAGTNVKYMHWQRSHLLQSLYTSSTWLSHFNCSERAHDLLF